LTLLHLVLFDNFREELPLWGLQKMELIKVKLEEYRTLRTESLQSMRNRNEILSFGTASVGIIFWAGTNLYASGKSIFSFYILLLLIPALCILLTYLWLGETERMSRVSVYLMRLEKQINKLIKSSQKGTHKNDILPSNIQHSFNGLYWENYLRTKPKKIKPRKLKRTHQMRYPYIAVLIIFYGIAVGSIIFSLSFIQIHEFWNYWYNYLLIGSLLLAVISNGIKMIQISLRLR